MNLFRRSPSTAPEELISGAAASLARKGAPVVVKKKPEPQQEEPEEEQEEAEQEEAAIVPEQEEAVATVEEAASVEEEPEQKEEDAPIDEKEDEAPPPPAEQPVVKKKASNREEFKIGRTAAPAPPVRTSVSSSSPARVAVRHLKQRHHKLTYYDYIKQNYHGKFIHRYKSRSGCMQMSSDSKLLLGIMYDCILKTYTEGAVALSQYRRAKTVQFEDFRASLDSMQARQKRTIYYVPNMKKSKLNRGIKHRSPQSVAARTVPKTV
jgi:hypothetical protein